MGKNDGKAKNPVFRNTELAEASNTPVTKQGVISKTILLLTIVAVVALLTGGFIMNNMSGAGMGTMGTLAIVAIILTLGLALLIGFQPHLARPLGFIYAIVEGFLLGVISMTAMQFNGGAVVPTALFIVVAVVFATNLLYTTGIIKVNKKFISIVFMMTAGAFFFYLFLFIGSFLGLDNSFMFDGSPLAIGIGLLMLLIASLNLFVDYFMIDEFVEMGTDKKYEWYLAFGLVLTIVWIYIEALRLVGNLTSSD